MKINKKLTQKVNADLVDYVINHIFPIYSTFDKAHADDHIVDVLNRSYIISKSVVGTVDYNIIFAVASFHDIGLRYGRQGHADKSAEIVENDNFLKTVFMQSEIDVIATAVREHSLSKNNKPSNIYSKIICDADKDDNPKRSLKRMWEFSIVYFSDRTRQEHMKLCYDYFCEKYKKGGKVKYYINSPYTRSYHKKMQKMAVDEKRFYKEFSKFIPKSRGGK